MFCTNCGAQISEEVKFCPNCGAEIKEKATYSEIAETEKQNRNAWEENNAQDGQTINNSALDSKTTSIVAYMTWIGYIVAMCAGDRENAKFYLNQSLVFHISCTLCIIPVIGWLWAIFMLICFILGVLWAAEQDPRELPLIGKLKLLS